MKLNMACCFTHILCLGSCLKNYWPNKLVSINYNIMWVSIAEGNFSM